MSLELELALRVVSEANQRGHWRKGARRASEQRAAARLALEPRLRAKDGRAVCDAARLAVYLVRVAPRELDGDNLQRALKACRDGVADALGIDDRDKRVTWLYEQVRGRVKQYAVRIRLVPADRILERVDP